MVGGALVVRAVEPPLLLDAQVILEAQQQVGRGHGAAAEEVSRHPVVAVLRREVIRDQAVREQVYEQLAVVAHPVRDLREQRAIVLHVLEVLDRQHAVEAGVAGGEFIGGHVPDDDLQVGDAARGGALLDEFALPRRVGEPDHLRLAIALGQPQRLRAPAAADIEDALAVHQLGALAVQLEHRVLGMRERVLALREVAAGLLHARAQIGLEEAGRHVVQLAAGGLRVGDQRGTVQFLDEGVERVDARHVVVDVLGAQLLPQQRADAAADHRVGDSPALAIADEPAIGVGDGLRVEGGRSHDRGLRS